MTFVLFATLVVLRGLAGAAPVSTSQEPGKTDFAKKMLRSTETSIAYPEKSIDGEARDGMERMLAVPSSSCSFAPYGQPVPMCSSVPYTHAHNDYEHMYPLFEALSYGFISAEADIFLYENDNDNLRVAHDPVEDPTTLPVLQELYLDPLLEQFHYHDNGGVYADGTVFHLLVDIKTEGESTYARLHDVLAGYATAHPGFLTAYTMTGNNTWDVAIGAVNVTISGERPRETMLAQEVRYATYDGRKSDIGMGVSPQFLHLLSDNWNNFFMEIGGDWDGIGPMPEVIKMAIKEAVDTVHAEGKLLRFWNLPSDSPYVWGPLVDAGVDFVNTDRLGPLSQFIRRDCAYAPFGQPVPACASLPYTHAHNDYEHEFPLFEALSWGFVSGEADIYLYDKDNGNLRVAHDPVDNPSTLPFLQDLYLDPLVEQFHFHNNGGIYSDGTVFHLLVDIKTEGESTYARLHEVLAGYAAIHPGFLTEYHMTGNNTWDVYPGALNVTISGNRSYETMMAQPIRYATYDGRKSDMGMGVSSQFLHLLSDNWNNFFGADSWDGEGEMPESIKTAVQEVADSVHAEGKLIRFWNLPKDDVYVWGPLVEAGIDFVNTDRLGPLSLYIEGAIHQ
ncbi:hypothetical protein ACA910_012705 [Epithemia clementina (nom. ined.)]